MTMKTHTRRPRNGRLGIVVAPPGATAAVMFNHGEVVFAELVVTEERPEFWEGDFVYVTRKGLAVFADRFDTKLALELLARVGAVATPVRVIGKNGRPSIKVRGCKQS